MRALCSLGFFFALLAVACSGADPTSLQNGGTNPGGDGGIHQAPGDSGVDPNDPRCDLSRCGITVPQGFTLVTTVDAKAECPGGLTKRDVVTDPVVAADACSCTCNVTQQPDCSTGTIHRYLDNQAFPQCSQMATTLTVMGAGCMALPGVITTQAQHYSATMTPSGGSCSFDAKADPTKVTSKALRVCEAPDNCQGAVCGGNVCVAKAGDVACPASFPVKHLVGAKANITCSSCGACTVDGTCTGTLSFYIDQNCTQGKRDFPVDGTCNSNDAFGISYRTYTFKGSLQKAGCSGQPMPSTGTATLDQPATLCCQK